MSIFQTGYSIAPHVPRERKGLLCAPEPFASIVNNISRLASQKGGLQYLKPERSKKMPGCWRPVFRIVTDINTGDSFFSGIDGYRANYAISVERGEACNRLFLDNLAPLLLQRVKACHGHVLAASLKSGWAKVWIGQKKGQFHDRFTMTDPEVLVPLWLANRRKAIDFGLEALGAMNRADRPLFAKAVWGARLHGPITVLEVMGAWVDRNGSIAAPPSDKTRRSQDLHEFGFA